MKIKWHKQKRKFTCGPSSLLNCMLYFGELHSEESIRILSKTTKKGTDEKGLIFAAKQFRFKINEVFSRSAEIFGRKLLKALKNQSTCLLLVNNLDHWISVLEYKKRKIKIIDSEYKIQYNRKIEQEMTLKQLKNFAINFDRLSKKPLYYFIEIIKK